MPNHLQKQYEKLAKSYRKATNNSVFETIMVLGAVMLIISIIF